MVTNVSYNGKSLGKICLDNDHTKKFVFVAEDLKSLSIILGLHDGEKVNIEGKGEISYEKFKMDYLENISGFYPDRDTYLLRNSRARSIEEFEEFSRIQQDY